MSKFDTREVIPMFTSTLTPTMRLHSRFVPSTRATFAMILLEKMDFVDVASTSPEIAVQRACDIAEKTFDEFEKRGWYDDVGTYAEAMDAAYEMDDRRIKKLRNK